jgi:hypothetical protein
MATVHEKWKKQMTEQGQQTFEEMGMDFSGAVEKDPEWLKHVSRLHYSFQNLQAAFDLGMRAHNSKDPQEVFEVFVEKIVGIKHADKNKREAAKARRK